MKFIIITAVLTVIFLLSAGALTTHAKAEQPEQTRPFTPAGTGTVIDNATNEDGKEFFTIKSANENIFYLVIDRQRETKNVYFLNAVTEWDLMALAEQGGDMWEPPEPIIIEVPVLVHEPAPEPIPQAEPEPRSNMGAVLLLLFVIIGGGIAGWYFKIFLPQQQAGTSSDSFDYDEEDDE